MQNNPPTYTHKRPHVASSVRSFCVCLGSFPIVVRLSRFSIRTFPIFIRLSRFFMSGIAIPLCVIPVSLRHIVSDPRPQVARPAPAGRVTRARRSRDPRPRVAGLLGGGNGNCGNKNENRGTLFCRSVSLRRNVPHLTRVCTTMMAPLPSVRMPYLAMSMKIIVARK